MGEGGGIEVDGHGTGIMTESSWINRNRNPDWSKAEVEQVLGKERLCHGTCVGAGIGLCLLCCGGQRGGRVAVAAAAWRWQRPTKRLLCCW